MNFEIKFTICLRKSFRNVKLKRKNRIRQQTNKQINETNNIKTEREMPSQPNPFFRKICYMQLTCFYLKILLSGHKPFMLWNNVIYFVLFPCKCHFLFFEFGKAISFSILFIFEFQL